MFKVSRLWKLNNPCCFLLNFQEHLIETHPFLSFVKNIQQISFHLQFEGELYLLATDQGYINQPDLVWEKLNEVKSVIPVFFFCQGYCYASNYLKLGHWF